MTRVVLSLVLLASVLAAQPCAKGFSLNGEIPTWYTDNTDRSPVGDVYGPVNLGEEYRWIVPQIIYAFDESFLNYFGQRGVEAVESAIGVVTNLPAMSELDLNDYPTFSMRVSFRARDLQLFDLKSIALQALLEQLGLATSTRFTFMVRTRDPQQFVTNYLVVMRNFDPETFAPTPYVNGQLWTYLTIFDNQDAPDTKCTTIPEPVDPLILAEPVASVIPNFTPTLFGYGSFYTGLTRDDVGGLKYIYRPENQNVETLGAEATGAAGTTVSSGGGPGVWTPIAPPATNTAAGGGTGTGTTPNVAFYPQAIRHGIDRIQMVRAGSGTVYQPGAYAVTNRFEEVVRVLITNGVERVITQRVSRVLTTPDLLFTAVDLAAPTTLGRLRRTDNAFNNDTINGNEVSDGPGQFNGPGLIEFSKAGPGFFNSFPGFITQPVSTAFYFWGSFDGTTNEPIVYPIGSSIRDVEALVFGGR